MGEAPLILVVQWEDFAVLTDEEIDRAWQALGDFVRIRAIARRRQILKQDEKDSREEMER